MKGSSQVDLLFITDPSKTEFNDTVDKILQRSEYDSLRTNVTNYIDRFREWLVKVLKDLLSGLFSNVEVGSGIADIIVIISLILFTILIIYIAVRIGRTFERRKKVREILGERIDENTTPATLKQKAAVSAQAGNIREAIRYDFIALLLLMHDRSVIYLEDTKTNGEIYSYLARKSFTALQPLKSCIDIFNLVWYGHKTEKKDIVYEEWTRNITVLWDEVTIYEAKVE